MTIGTVIDQAQQFLHDAGAIWSRAELLYWANDGYRQLLTQSHAVVRPFQLDVPGRTAWAGSQEWEDQQGGGTWRKFSFTVRSTAIQSTHRWEAQMLEGIAPSDSGPGSITHLWEMFYGSGVDQHMRLVLSKQHERPLKVYHDDKRLIGASTRELDTLNTQWWTQTGSPIFWFPTEGGRDGSYEIYELASAYVQAYDQQDAETGLPRLFSGNRTYVASGSVDRWDYAYSGSGDAGMVPGLGYRFTGASVGGVYDTTFAFERSIVDSTTLPTADASTVGSAWWEIAFDSTIDDNELTLGLVRGVSSPDRQYVAAPYANAQFNTLGIPRDFKSSADAITIWEIIVSATELGEGDGLSLIPGRMAKYLKFYILSRAFSNKGPGYRPDLAQHFTSLFQIGVALLTKIGNQGFIDRNYGREMVTPTRGYRPPMVQLPPEFERF